MASIKLFICVFFLAVAADFGWTVDVVETDEFFGPIRKCPKGLSDEKLSECLSEIVLSMGQLFKDGIPEIDLKTIDPFLMDRFDYTLNLRPITVNARFTDIKIRHLAEYNIANFKLDMKNKRMSFELGAPIVRAEGNYEISGNLFVLPMIGNGPAWIDVTGGKSMGEMSFKIGRDNKGKEILQVDEFKLDLVYDDAKMVVTGLLNRHPTLKRAGPLINRLLNDYNKELFEIIKPQFVQQVSEIVKELFNHSFARMPFMVEYF